MTVVMVPMRRLARVYSSTSGRPTEVCDGDILHDLEGGFRLATGQDKERKFATFLRARGEEMVANDTIIKYPPPALLVLYLNLPSVRGRVEGSGVTDYAVFREVMALTVPVLTDPARRDKLLTIIAQIEKIKELRQKQIDLMEELVASLAHEYLIKPTIAPKKEEPTE